MIVLIEFMLLLFTFFLWYLRCCLAKNIKRLKGKVLYVCRFLKSIVKRDYPKLWVSWNFHLQRVLAIGLGGIKKEVGRFICVCWFVAAINFNGKAAFWHYIHDDLVSPSILLRKPLAFILNHIYLRFSIQIDGKTSLLPHDTFNFSINMNRKIAPYAH